MTTQTILPNLRRARVELVLPQPGNSTEQAAQRHQFKA